MPQQLRHVWVAPPAQSHAGTYPKTHNKTALPLTHTPTAESKYQLAGSAAAPLGAPPRCRPHPSSPARRRAVTRRATAWRAMARLGCQWSIETVEYRDAEFKCLEYRDA